MSASDRTEAVLVTGGAGYIGSALVPMLLNAGKRVRVLDALVYGKRALAPVADHPALELVEGDFRSVDVVVEAMEGMDAVVHLGAIVGDAACSLDRTLTIDVNLKSTQNVAHVAQALGVSRMIFASTCSVYGACDEMLWENSQASPVSLYGRTKLAAERGLIEMCAAPFEPTIVRFATMYGLSGRCRFDLVVNLLAAKAEMEGCITVHGGAQWRPFVHVEDAALALQTILDAPLSQVGGEVFNVGSGAQNHTIKEVAKMVVEHVPTTEMVVDEKSADRRNYRVNFDKLEKGLGYRPRWTVEDGIGQVIEAVGTGAVADYKDIHYDNAGFLKASGLEGLCRSGLDWTEELSAVERASAAG